MRAVVESCFEQVMSGASGRIAIISQQPFMIAAVNDSERASLFARVSVDSLPAIGDGMGFAIRNSRVGADEYIQITAAERGLPRLFLNMAEYIVERVSRQASVAGGIEELIGSVESYRRFVARRGGRLTDAAIQGTFAELLFFRLLLSSGLAFEKVVSAWRGPWARSGLGVRDFTFTDGRSVEIKSARQPAIKVRVASPVQLAPSDDALDLIVLPVERVPKGSAGAVGFYETVVELGEVAESAGDRARDLWLDALGALNLDLEDQWYQQYFFAPGRWSRYRVIEGFPFLPSSCISVGVVDVRYSLDLEALRPFSADLGSLLDEARSL